MAQARYTDQEFVSDWSGYCDGWSRWSLDEWCFDGDGGEWKEFDVKDDEVEAKIFLAIYE